MKFFLNSKTTSYLRGLEGDFGDSSNSIRLELNALEKAGMLSSFLQGNKKMFRANVKHPLFNEIHSILLKQIGIDSIIENVIERLGDVDAVYLVGEFARGLDSTIIDLIFVGEIDKNYLLELVGKVEKIIKRKIRYLIYSDMEYQLLNWNTFEVEPFLLWNKEE